MKMHKKTERFQCSGFSIAEAAFSIGIITIISAAVGSLLSSSFNAQELQNSSINAQLAANSFTEALRTDTRAAVGITLSNGGRTMTLYYFKSRNPNNGAETLATGRFVEYRVEANGRLVRQANIDTDTRQNRANYTTVFVDPFNAAVPATRNSPTKGLRTTCNGACFAVNLNDTTGVAEQCARVTVQNLRIEGLPPALAQNLTPMDAFGQPGVSIVNSEYELGGFKRFR